MKQVSTIVTETELSYILRKHLRPVEIANSNLVKFITSFVNCRDVKQASRDAGIQVREGRNLRNRPSVFLAISEITEKALLKHGYDASEVIERVKEILSIDPVELENEDGSFKKSLKDVPPEARRSIKKFKAKNLYGTDANGIAIVIGELIEVEFWDKMKAAELLGREKNIFKETKKIEHDLTVNMSSVLLESKKRALEPIDVTPRPLPLPPLPESNT